MSQIVVTGLLLLFLLMTLVLIKNLICGTIFAFRWACETSIIAIVIYFAGWFAMPMMMVFVCIIIDMIGLPKKNILKKQKTPNPEPQPTPAPPVQLPATEITPPSSEPIQ